MSRDPDLDERKRRLRRELLARRRALADPAREAAGHAVVALLDTFEPFLRASTVALYAALPDELPTRPCFERLRRRGARVLLPRMAGERTLRFHPVDRWEELAPGRYGVLEPPAGSGGLPPGEAEVVLVPGVAFDPAGHRLGRGGGFYDAAFPPGGARPLLVGLGFELQVIEAVPCGSWDRTLDAVVTEQLLRRVTERR